MNSAVTTGFMTLAARRRITPPSQADVSATTVIPTAAEGSARKENSTPARAGKKVNMYLIAEYCDGTYYVGWHLYYRDSESFQRNSDGEWGWIREPTKDMKLIKFLSSLGITISGDGTTDRDGIAEFARRFPLKWKNSGGSMRRGGVEINIIDGNIEIKKNQKACDK